MPYRGAWHDLGMKPALQIRLNQQLALTPQLQQAIRLLQLSSMELELELNTAIESNPLLELEAERSEDGSDGEPDPADGAESPADNAESSESASESDDGPLDQVFDQVLFALAQRVAGLDEDGLVRDSARTGASRGQVVATGITLAAVTLGGIYWGWFSPTEAAAIGAFGAMLLGFLLRRLGLKQAITAFIDTVRTTSALTLIVMGSTLFSYFVVQTGIARNIADLLGLPRGARLHIGADAVVEITGLRNPCAQLDHYQQGLTAAVLGRHPDGSLMRRAGVMGELAIVPARLVQPAARRSATQRSPKPVSPAFSRKPQCPPQRSSCRRTCAGSASARKSSTGITGSSSAIRMSVGTCSADSREPATE